MHERYFGDYSQLTKEELLQGIIPLDAESTISFQKRVDSTFHSVMKAEADEFCGKKKIIVSHGVFFKQLSSKLTGNEISIKYGEVFLFTPLQDSKDKWIAQKIS